MQFVATIAVVASVLVFALQARELARQSRVGNEVAGTQAHREIVFHWKTLMDVFIQHPELSTLYFDQSANTPGVTESIRLGLIAEQHADWLEVALVTHSQLRPYDYADALGEWDDYVSRVVASSAILRSTIRARGDWPALVPFVSRYEESRAGVA